MYSEFRGHHETGYEIRVLYLAGVESCDPPRRTVNCVALVYQSCFDLGRQGMMWSTPGIVKSNTRSNAIIQKRISSTYESAMIALTISDRSHY